MIEILTAAAPLAMPLAVIIVCMTIICIILAVLFGGLILEAGSEKWGIVKLSKRPKSDSARLERLNVEPIPEKESLPAALAVPVPHEPVPQQAEAANAEKEEAERRDDEAFANYFVAKNLRELEASFEPFMLSSGSKNAEFWQTDYLERRQEYGADRVRDEMRDLAAQHPTWSYPYVVLINWALRDHDFLEARKYLDAGLTKTQSPQFGSVLSAGVRLIFKTDGKYAALSFACQWSKADLAESIRSSTFVTLADLLKEAGDIEGSHVTLEFASSLQPSNKERNFSLGYNYAETISRWAPAIWKYQQCIDAQSDDAITRNNIGIIYAQIDKAVAVQTYEQASRDGDKYASANLAHLLIEDGYISIAQSLLDGVEDPGSAAENHAAARAAGLRARRRTEEKLAEITEVARANIVPYKASLSAAFRELQRGNAGPVIGSFASADRNVIAVIDGEKARCQLRIGTFVFEGSLQNQITCFAGWLSTRGASLLSTEVSQFTLLNEGNKTLRLFRWPSKIGLEHRIEVYELQLMDSIPELAPPPPSPPPTGLGLLGPLFMQNDLIGPKDSQF